MMKLESTSRQIDLERAVEAFGNAEPEFRFNGFSHFTPAEKLFSDCSVFSGNSSANGLEHNKEMFYLAL